MDDSASRCENVQIASQQDADGLNSCGTVTGDILISGSAAGQITLTGVSNITGSLQLVPCASNACDGLTSFSSPDLLEVGENVVFDNLATLNEILLPKLQLNGLPALKSIPFDSLTSVTSIIILDTPLLSSAIFGVMSAFRSSPDMPETQVEISNTNLTGFADIFAGA